MVMIHGLVDSFSLPMAPHNPNGPVCHAASMHVAMAWEEASTLEIMVTDVPWRGAIFDEACTFADGRSEGRRVGKDCVRTCRSRWSADHEKKQQKSKKQSTKVI